MSIEITINSYTLIIFPLKNAEKIRELIRELKSLLKKAGFIYRSTKGSHTRWYHPSLHICKYSLILLSAPLRLCVK
ncbi:type II toxin-antitoxin system HicA family toxin [Dolichospermum circinale]|uniref:type II toxin-antitoxin system HicA family toxin n=1 Tax=Dolichospermum circinale TaxID=109265 RepID=UPI002FEE5390